MSLREYKPEPDPRLEYVKANAKLWRVLTVGQVPSEHPLIGASFGTTTVEDDLPKKKAKRLVKTIRSRGGQAFMLPTPAEFERLSPDEEES